MPATIRSRESPEKTEGTIISVRRYGSPCGELLLGSCRDELCLCDWIGGRHPDTAARRLKETWHARFDERPSAVLGTACKQLDEYFAGERKQFTIPLRFCGTAFQRAVWQELLKIPHGTTTSYGELAGRLGRPSAVRAVANATAANAISLFAPCHRVLGSHHALRGYRGGQEAQRCLLQLESSLLC